MPHGDGTGPRGDGPNSGNSPGNCKPRNQNRDSAGQKGMKDGRGQGRRKGKGQGNGQGRGRKSGQNRGSQA